MSEAAKIEFSLWRELSFAVGALIATFGLAEVIGVSDLLRGVALILVTRWADAMAWLGAQISLLPNADVNEVEASGITILLVFIAACVRLLIFRLEVSIAFIFRGTRFSIIDIIFLVVMLGLCLSTIYGYIFLFDIKRSESTELNMVLILFSLALVSFRTFFYISVWFSVFLMSSWLPTWATNPPLSGGG